MNTRTLPPLLEGLLASDTTLDGATKTALARFSPILAKGGMPFFPEYANHGIDHFDSVLCSAISLVSDDARSILTPEDAAVLVVAALLHDLGMHIQQAGF